MSRRGSESEPSLLDWARARERLDELGRAIADDAPKSASETDRILEERARLLASPYQTVELTAAMEVVAFTIAEKRFGVESHFVLEVANPGAIALVPRAPPPLIGLAAWRGELIRVLDLHQILGLSSRQEEDVGKLVVLADDQQRFAVRVDAVDGIRELQQAELLPPTADPSTQLEFIDGRTADGMLVLQAEELIRAYTRGANH